MTLVTICSPASVGKDGGGSPSGGFVGGITSGSISGGFEGGRTLLSPGPNLQLVPSLSRQNFIQSRKFSFCACE
jgi:hypothetical protein